MPRPSPPTSPAADASAAAWLAAYHRDGFVLLRGLLAPARVDEIRRAVEAAPEREAGDNALSLGAMRFASNLFYGSPPLQVLLASPPITTVIAALVGRDAWVRWDQAVWKHPGAPEFPLHQDNGYTGLTAEHLQLWIALTPSAEADGGLLVAPGAHRTPLPHAWEGNHARALVDLDLVPVDADPGDVIAFSSLLPHATAPNTGSRTRLAYVAEVLPWSELDASVPLPHLRLSCTGAGSARWVADHP